MRDGGETESIGARVRRLRRERGLSQRDLAEPGVSYAYVSRIEAGARQPSLKAIRILANKLGVSPEYLETGAGIPKAYEREIRLGDAELGLALGEAVEESEETFRALLAEAREAADTAAATRSRAGLGMALAQRGRTAEAVAQLERAVDADGVTPATKPAVYAALGRTAAADGRATAAMASLRRAAGLLETTDDMLELARAHLHCAELLMLEDKADQAGPHLDRADLLLALGGDRADLGALRTQQAHRAVRLKAPEEAAGLAREALEHLAERASEQGSAWHALGSAQAMNGDVEAALDSFGRAVELLREAGEWREAMTAYRRWAQVLREVGRNQDAVDIIEQATLLTLRNATASRRSQRARS